MCCCFFFFFFKGGSLGGTPFRVASALVVEARREKFLSLDIPMLANYILMQSFTPYFIGISHNLEFMFFFVLYIPVGRHTKLKFLSLIPS